MKQIGHIGFQECFFCPFLSALLQIVLSNCFATSKMMPTDFINFQIRKNVYNRNGNKYYIDKIRHSFPHTGKIKTSQI